MLPRATVGRGRPPCALRGRKGNSRPAGRHAHPARSWPQGQQRAARRHAHPASLYSINRRRAAAAPSSVRCDPGIRESRRSGAPTEPRAGDPPTDQDPFPGARETRAPRLCSAYLNKSPMASMRQTARSGRPHLCKQSKGGGEEGRRGRSENFGGMWARRGRARGEACVRGEADPRGTCSERRAGGAPVEWSPPRGSPAGACGPRRPRKREDEALSDAGELRSLR
jgi:hypothetical protein